MYSIVGGVNWNWIGLYFEVLVKIENRLMEFNINVIIIKLLFFMDNFLCIVKVEDECIILLEFINLNIKFIMIFFIDIVKIVLYIFVYL